MCQHSADVTQNRSEAVWRDCSVLILKKLGPELFEELLEVVNYLGKVEGMRVIVEPQEYEALVRPNLLA